MNDFFARVNAAVRAAVHRLQTWFNPPLDSETQPLEIREAIIEEIEQRVEPAGGGRRVLPYNHVTITLLAADKQSRARLQAALNGLQEAIAARLGELRCAIPAAFTVDTKFITRPPASWRAEQRLALDYDAREVASTASPASDGPPRLRITVVRGQTTEPSYNFADPHIRIGRTAQPIDGRGRPRTNNVVFLEEGDDHTRTVGRAHASIRYDASRREYRVFDDGSHNGTRVMREGMSYDVKPHDPVGVTLRSGDEILLGTAAIRIDVERPGEMQR